MKRILFTFAFLTLLWGCGELSAQVDKPKERVMPARMKVRIVCNKETFRFGEPLTIMIMMQKLVDEEIRVPIAYWSAIVRVDGKDFKRPWGPKGGPNGIMDTSWPCPPWSGPGLMPKDFEVGVALTFSEYGISKDVLSVGTHEIAIVIDQVVSNNFKIKVKVDNE
ncbi:MAG: hypothetical protein WCP55_17195 [Lentisphaerota bacterium]